MGTRRGRRAALLLWVVLAAGAAAPAPGADPEEDMRAVYCLAGPHRAELVEAAVHLGLGRTVPGMPEALAVDPAPVESGIGPTTYTPDQWRAAAPGPFERACSALIATVPQLKAPSEPNALLALLVLIIPLVAGALLTLAVQRVDAAIGRRGKERDDLRQAAEQYGLAAREYIAAWVDDPNAPDGPLSEKVAALTIELRKFGHGRRLRPEADRLISALPIQDALARVIHDHSPNHARRVTLGQQESRRVAAIIGDTEALIHGHTWNPTPLSAPSPRHRPDAAPWEQPVTPVAGGRAGEGQGAPEART